MYTTNWWDILLTNKINSLETDNNYTRGYCIVNSDC